jgi:hypothetical protein
MMLFMSLLPFFRVIGDHRCARPHILTQRQAARADREGRGCTRLPPLPCSGSPSFSLGQTAETGACQAFFMVSAVLSTLSFTFSAILAAVSFTFPTT